MVLVVATATFVATAAFVAGCGAESFREAQPPFDDAQVAASSTHSRRIEPVASTAPSGTRVDDEECAYYRDIRPALDDLFGDRSAPSLVPSADVDRWLGLLAPGPAPATVEREWSRMAVLVGRLDVTFAELSERWGISEADVASGRYPDDPALAGELDVLRARSTVAADEVRQFRTAVDRASAGCPASG